MIVPRWIGPVLGRRHRSGKLAARKVARERAAVEAAEHRAQESHGDLPVVPSQGDLMCFHAAIHPC